MPSPRREKYRDYTLQDRTDAVCKLVRRALPYPLDVALPGEVQLFLCILLQAILDSRPCGIGKNGGAVAGYKVDAAATNRESAIAYLSRPVIHHAEWLGLETSYIHRLIREFGLFELAEECA